MRRILAAIFGIGVLLCCSPLTRAQKPTVEWCSRPAPRSAVPEPEDLHSENGVLQVDLTMRNDVAPDGQTRYCYIAADGSQSPNLRLRPGDLLVLHLKNDLTEDADQLKSRQHTHSDASSSTNPCARGEMSAVATNLHFHGMAIPPVCHQDDVLKTAIDPFDPPFEYRVRIPADQPPGLYWYHPHIHGFAESKILGGASGALIIEGIERVNAKLAGLPERVFVVRDQPLVNPNAQPIQTGSMPPPIVLKDAEGDILNAGKDGGMPARDLSINQVTVAFPKYEPAVIRMKPSERQLWRVLNASADTYLDLQVLFANAPQFLGVVALDGVPIAANGSDSHQVLWESHISLPPAARAEFVLNGPPAGTAASFVTRKVDTGRDGENDPTRPLAAIVTSPDAPEPQTKLSAATQPAIQPHLPWLGSVNPIRQRTLYFWEKPQDPSDPKSPIVYGITEDGHTAEPFDPNASAPDITVQQGTVEDWIIENRTQELHAFHIHQLHFVLEDWNGVPIEEPYLRDTINVPYWDGKSQQFPSVKLRMDFRDPEIVGTFVYHCHILEHEDGGMMGTIRVAPAAAKP
ncbi:MAG: multicopper oxidase domain-containing protein [Candidatus Acidiferrales bacterium]